MTFTVYAPRASRRLSVSFTVAATRFAAAFATNREPFFTDARTVPERGPLSFSVSVRPLTLAERTASTGAAGAIAAGAGAETAGAGAGASPDGAAATGGASPAGVVTSAAGCGSAPVFVSSTIEYAAM